MQMRHGSANSFFEAYADNTYQKKSAGASRQSGQGLCCLLTESHDTSENIFIQQNPDQTAASMTDQDLYHKTYFLMIQLILFFHLICLPYL